MKKCAQCHGKLGLGICCRNLWNGRWWAHTRFCSARCEGNYELERYNANAKQHRWYTAELTCLPGTRPSGSKSRQPVVRDSLLPDLPNGPNFLGSLFEPQAPPKRQFLERTPSVRRRAAGWARINRLTSCDRSTSMLHSLTTTDLGLVITVAAMAACALLSAMQHGRSMLP